MQYPWLDAHCLAKAGTEKDDKAEWEATRYSVKEKMYAMLGGDKDGTPILTVKLDPAFGELLRREYPDVIVPGYYMNKVHWNSLYLHGGVPDEVARDMLDQAYGLVLASLPKKVQAEILATQKGAGQ